MAESTAEPAAKSQTEIRVAACDGTDETEVAQVTLALQGLIPQLSSSAGALSQAQVAAIASHAACTLLVARGPIATGPAGEQAEPAPSQPAQSRQPAPGQIVGAMVLVVFPLPTGIRAWIEDVVVDESARGQGVGELLNRRAIEIATAAGARTVDLTSRPSRAAANRLYQRLGFEPRTTNLYRLELD